MNAGLRELQARLQAFDLDGDSPRLTFAGRLARESGWSLAFAQRVVDEYKRFVLLAATAGHPVTPSEQVDQAWHLHLTYTRSYWERMCGEVLGKPLHHNPTRGGEREDAKFDDWYARTLETYRAVFGEEPPADIWTPADRRFGDDLRWRRVNVAENWVLPRRAARKWGAWAAGIAAAVGVGTALVGCATNNSYGATTNVALLVIGGGVVLLVLMAILARWARRGGDGTGSGGCGGSWWFGGCGSNSGGGRSGKDNYSGESDVGDSGGDGGGSGGDGGGSGGCGGGCGGD